MRTSNTLIASLPSSKHNSKRFMSVTQATSKSIVVRRSDLDAFCYYCFYFITIAPSALSEKVQFDIEVNLNRDAGEEAKDLILNKPLDELQSFTLPQPGQSVQFKFLMESKEDFEIKIFLESSQAEMFISLYPEKTSDYIWYASLGIGTKVLSISTADPDFFLGTYYYLTVKSIQSRVTGKIQLSQRNTFNLVADSVMRKDNFWTDGDLVKFYVFEFPESLVKTSRSVKVEINTLTDYFQPLLLVNKTSFPKRQTSFSVDKFPNVNLHSEIYGNEVVSQINQKDFEYNIKMDTQQWSYLFVSVYNFVYGMTSEKKPVYYITFTSDDSKTTRNPKWESLVNDSVPAFSLKEALFE